MNFVRLDIVLGTIVNQYTTSIASVYEVGGKEYFIRTEHRAGGDIRNEHLAMCLISHDSAVQEHLLGENRKLITQKVMELRGIGKGPAA